MATKKKIINVGVLLSDDPILREALSSEGMIDEFIEPRDVNQMLGYFKKLVRRGQKVHRLVFFGHGNKLTSGVGMLGINDVDRLHLGNWRKSRRDSRESIKEELASAKKQLKATDDRSKRKEIEKTIRDRQESLKNVNDAYKDALFKETAYGDIENLMDTGGQIGVFSCWAANGKTGARFLNALADSFLSKRGGFVFGSDGKNEIGYRKTIINWLTENKPYKVKTTGKWHVIERKVSGKSLRCGAACKDFERYWRHEVALVTVWQWITAVD